MDIKGKTIHLETVYNTEDGVFSEVIEMEDSVIDLVAAIVNDDSDACQDAFKQAVAEKMLDKIDQQKAVVVGQMFGEK